MNCFGGILLHQTMKHRVARATRRISLNKMTCKGLEKIEAGKRSKIIEEALCPVLRQYDSGESCETLRARG